MIEIQSYDSSSSTYRLHLKLINKIELSTDINSSNRESLFIKDICKRIEKLKNDDDIIGLVALSATSINDQPSVQVDYIFVSENIVGKKLWNSIAVNHLGT